MLNLAKLYITQVSSSSVSLLASTFITIAILRTDGGLTSPYRRIIFGLSASDILQSLAMLTGPILVPAGLWAHGNDITCRTNGVFFILGSRGISLYVLMLCLYSALKTKRSWGITDTKFCEKIEKKLHVFIIMFAVGLSIAGLATKTINSNVVASVCLFSALPTTCRQNPNIECNPGSAETTKLFISISSTGLEMFCLIGVVVCMVIICINIFKQGRITRGIARDSTHRTNRDETRTTFGASNEIVPSPPTDRIAKEFEKEVFIQALLFVIAYLVTYFARWVSIIELMRGNQPSEAWLLACFLFYPLGGFFNVLVYTRPKVAVFKRRHPEYSLIKAFWLIIKSGNQIPELPDNSGNEGSISTNEGCKKKDSSHDISLYADSMDDECKLKDGTMVIELEKPRWEGATSDAKPLRPLRRDTQTESSRIEEMESGRMYEDFRKLKASFASSCSGSGSRPKKMVSFASSLTTETAFAEDIFELSPQEKSPKSQTHPSFQHLSPTESGPSKPMRSTSPCCEVMKVLVSTPVAVDPNGSTKLRTQKERGADDAVTVLPVLPLTSEAEKDVPRSEVSKISRGPPQVPVRFLTEESHSESSIIESVDQEINPTTPHNTNSLRNGARAEDTRLFAPQLPVRFLTEESGSFDSV